MLDPHEIRRLIQTNLIELEGFSNVFRAPTGNALGRPGTAYYLNEEQALLVCLTAS